MKAYLLRNTGGISSLKISDVFEPNPERNEVKVKIISIGINYAEILSRRGQYSWAPKLPYIPGMEAYGEIVALGEGVENHKVGDRVIIGSQTGSYAEFICVPSYLAFPPPEKFSEDECAAYLVNFITAWVALMKLGKVNDKDIVLLHAAAGGVGTAAIQIAKAIGSTVIGTASNNDKIELINQIGADLSINYANEDFYQIIKNKYGGVDMVLEVVGGEVYKKSIKLLNPFGRLVVTGFASISFNKWNPITWWQTWRDAPKVNVMNMAKGSYGVMGTHVGYLTEHQSVIDNEWGNMKSFTEKNNLKPIVGKTFNFDEMAQAHQWMESRKSVGKIVVKL